MLQSMRVLFFLALAALSSSKPVDEMSAALNRISADPDISRDCLQMIASKGYPVESHTIRTEDDYFLTVFRIPHGKNEKPSDDSRPVVLLAHGILDVSTTWVMNNETQSLGFILADHGFDVWLMNVRGNKYSLRHATLSTDDNAFWDFTWDDHARLDLPNTVDFVLKTTRTATLGYVCHSQGCTQALAALSQHTPGLAGRINMLVGLAPVAYLSHTGSILLKALSVFNVDKLAALLGLQSFLPSSALLRTLLPWICRIEIVCDSVIYLIAGFDKENFDNNRLAVYTSHFPDGTSVKNMGHWAQMVRSGSFGMYDYENEAKNLEAYGVTSPPAYQVENITVPMAFFSGGRDDLVSTKDLQKLMNRLPESVSLTIVPKYGHLDFVWGMYTFIDIYPQVVEQLRKGIPS